ncbi:pyridoxal phosphate-dependent aminotransferase [Methanocaldococcus sp.]
MVANRVKNIEKSMIREIFNLATSDCINLGIGEPDFDTPDFIKEGAKRALDMGKTHYSPNLGIPELREAIAEKLKEDYDLNINSNNIMVTCGASEALHLSLLGLIDRGEKVIIINPYFVSYKALSQLAEAKICEFKTDENFNIDLDKLNEMAEGAKAIIFNSPTNPTGKVYDKETIKGLAEIAEDNSLYIISDEVYDKIIYEKKHYSPLKYTDRAILINSFSKTYAMTGWRVGYLVADEIILNNFLKIHQYSVACVNTFSQYGALEAIKKGDSFTKKMVNEFKRRRDLIYKGLKKFFDVYKPDGTFYIFPNISEYGKDIDIIKKLIENKILAVPGSTFGDSRYIRFSFATKLEDIKRALEILEEIL